MKATFEFNMESPDDCEIFRRHCVTDRMAELLYDLANGSTYRNRTLPEEVRQQINEWMIEDGINMEDIYT